MPAKTLRLWASVVLFEFFIAACIGVILRFAFVTEIPFIKYKFILHAHSHVAMMGWLFGALYILIVQSFCTYRLIYSRLFWLFQISIAGMLFSFPIQGYGMVSIFFTTLHLLLSYVFIYQVFKDIRANQNMSRKFLKMAFLFLILSSVATWALGPLMKSSLNNSSWYYNAIQFFLHFQFNGWFIFAIISIFLKYAGDRSAKFNIRDTNRFYTLLVVSCFLTYALSVTWSTPDKIIFWFNSLGVLMQLLALFVFIKPVGQIVEKLNSKVKKITKILWGFALICFVIKILIQTLVAIPQIAIISYTVHNFVIGFIHLLMLGALSTFILGAFHEFQILKINTLTKKIGIVVFICGILMSEFLLFGQGIMLWAKAGFMANYYILLASVSTFLPVGIGMFAFSRSSN